jgi:hypothetical protein
MRSKKRRSPRDLGVECFGRDGPPGRLRNAAQRRRFGTSGASQRPGASLAVADIASSRRSQTNTEARCPYLEPRIMTNIQRSTSNEDLRA